jgi:non-heme chloroperoxidase
MTATVLNTSRSGVVYGRRGAGPTVVLVHGWCLDRTMWSYLEQSLVEAGHEVITPALAGYGASSHLAGPHTMARHGEDLADLLDELELTDATAVGFAYGAAVLFHLPIHDRVGGLVLIGVPNASGAPYPRMRGAIQRDWPLFAQRSVRAICHVEHSDATLAWMERMYVATPLATALAGVDELAAFEPAEREQPWTVPSLFVHGRQDTIVDPAVSKACVARFEQAELVEVEECGHYVVLDQRQALHDAVVRLTAQVGKDS